MELIEIGKALVADPPPDSQAIMKISDHFKRHKAGFKHMTLEIGNSTNPADLLFTSSDLSLRPVSDIAHLFLCLFQFYDGFDGFLMDMLQECTLKPTDNTACRVLQWILYLLALSEDKDYRKLQVIFENPQADKDPKRLLGGESPMIHLYQFCKALQQYVFGLYLTRAPWLKERIDGDLFQQRNKMLAESHKALGVRFLPEEWANVRKYFIVRVYTIQTEAHRQTKPRSPEVISEAFKIIKKAKEELGARITILEPS